MICFFTSAADVHGEHRLNPANGFIEELRRYFPENGHGLFICSYPDDYAATDLCWTELRGYLAAEGMRLSGHSTLDGRTADRAAELIAQADLIVLSGGHVPTQNAFFQAIGLRELLNVFEGLLISISAGTMNSADVVYAMPELDGEAVDTAFCRTLPGLGLHNFNLIPHYQYIRTLTLDGMPMEEIAKEDSATRRIYVIDDGSYFFVGDGRCELRGEASVIEKGVITHICSHGQIIEL